MEKAPMTAKIKAEYIWIDGQKPGKLRSKTKVLNGKITGANQSEMLKQIPYWGFDGSSTEQAKGHFSDCMLKPVYIVPDPVEGGDNILVMCEVMNPNGTPHKSNTRHRLAKAMRKYRSFEPMVGIEQEYTMYGKNNWPFGWPEGYAAPQGQAYCGVGWDEVHGRALKDAHLNALMIAGFAVEGTNAEVMPSQWEFQIGAGDPLEMADQLWIARWLLYRLGEDFGAYAKLDPKPIKEGDWNGAGGHINFSTNQMRKKGGYGKIITACKKLSKFHREHIAAYGPGNRDRLTGKHETCGIDQFQYGVSNRGASIRIPMSTANKKMGYLEDRRPAANLDPYKALTALLDTICGDGFNPKKYKWEPDVVVETYKIKKTESAEAE